MDWQRVLFEPTKAQVAPFRTTFNGAVSYIVAGDADFAEDHGFALAPLQPCALRECMHDEVEPIAHDDEGHYVFADMHSHGVRPRPGHSARRVVGSPFVAGLALSSSSTGPLITDHQSGNH